MISPVSYDAVEELAERLPPREQLRLVEAISHRLGDQFSVDSITSNRPSVSAFVWPNYDVGPWPAGFTVRREDLYDDAR